MQLGSKSVNQCSIGDSYAKCQFVVSAENGGHICDSDELKSVRLCVMASILAGSNC